MLFFSSILSFLALLGLVCGALPEWKDRDGAPAYNSHASLQEAGWSGEKTPRTKIDMEAIAKEWYNRLTEVDLKMILERSKNVVVSVLYVPGDGLYASTVPLKKADTSMADHFLKTSNTKAPSLYRHDANNIIQGNFCAEEGAIFDWYVANHENVPLVGDQLPAGSLLGSWGKFGDALPDVAEPCKGSMWGKKQPQNSCMTLLRKLGINDGRVPQARPSSPSNQAGPSTQAGPSNPLKQSEPEKPKMPAPQKPKTPEPQKPKTPEPQKPKTPEPTKPKDPKGKRPVSPGESPTKDERKPKQPGGKRAIAFEA